MFYYAFLCRQEEEEELQTIIEVVVVVKLSVIYTHPLLVSFFTGRTVWIIVFDGIHLHTCVSRDICIGFAAQVCNKKKRVPPSRHCRECLGGPGESLAFGPRGLR